MTEIANLGKAILYTSAFLLPIMLIFLVAMQVREKIRDQKHFKEVGGKTLPLKGIRKVIEAISGASRKNKKRTSQEMASRRDEEGGSQSDFGGVLKKVNFKEPSKEE